MHDYGIINTEEEVILAPLESNGLVPYLLLRWQHLVSLGYHTVLWVWSMSDSRHLSYGVTNFLMPMEVGDFFLQIWEKLTEHPVYWSVASLQPLQGMYKMLLPWQQIPQNLYFSLEGMNLHSLPPLPLHTERWVHTLSFTIILKKCYVWARSDFIRRLQMLTTRYPY